MILLYQNLTSALRMGFYLKRYTFIVICVFLVDIQMARHGYIFTYVTAASISNNDVE